MRIRVQLLWDNRCRSSLGMWVDGFANSEMMNFNEWRMDPSISSRSIIPSVVHPIHTIIGGVVIPDPTTTIARSRAIMDDWRNASISRAVWNKNRALPGSKSVNYTHEIERERGKSKIISEDHWGRNEELKVTYLDPGKMREPPPLSSYPWGSRLPSLSCVAILPIGDGVTASTALPGCRRGPQHRITPVQNIKIETKSPRWAHIPKADNRTSHAVGQREGGLVQNRRRNGKEGEEEEEGKNFTSNNKPQE